MTEQIEVVYENGMLRPVGPPPAGLREHQRYVVTVELPGTPAAPKDVPSLEEVRAILAKVPETATALVRAERERR
jgi:predicted DNA-binding antitoxin AbrB/MazE fold protein